MQGFMRRRGPSWELRVYLGRHPSSGAKRYATRSVRGDGTPESKPLSASTVRRIHGVAHRALNIGVRWGWLAANPARGTMPPRPIRRPITPPDPTEVAALIAAARRSDPALGALLQLAAVTGARRGELCALRWSDLNLATGELDIVRAVTLVNGHAVIGPTKTRRARRIHLDPATLDALSDHGRRIQPATTPTEADGSMFPAPTGDLPWRPDQLSRSFRRLTQEVGLDHVRFHDLRHYVTTRLLGAGIDLRTVAGRLGHSYATTLNIYAAFLPDADQRAAALMARLLEPSNRTRHHV